MQHNPYLSHLASFQRPVHTNRTCISLFSGGGGLDLGAYLAGFRTLLASDIMPKFVATIHHNMPHTGIFAGDAMLLSADDIRQRANLGVHDLDLMIAGPPCQSFSILGKRKSLDDPRGQLSFKYFQFIHDLSPKAFLFENVPGLLTVNQGTDFATLWNYMQETTGYTLFRRICNASDYGIPQYRSRVFIIGFRPDIHCDDFHFPERFSGDVDLPQQVPSKWALEEIENLPNHVIRRHGEVVKERYRLTPPGTRCKTDHTDRMHPDVPAGTVLVGSSAGGGRPHIHPFEPRVITVREAARLQGFPDWYVFCGSTTEQYRQVGNAVPPLMAYEILKNVRNILDNNP